MTGVFKPSGLSGQRPQFRRLQVMAATRPKLATTQVKEVFDMGFKIMFNMSGIIQELRDKNMLIP